MPIRRNIRLLAAFNFFTDFILFAPIAILYFADVAGSWMLGMGVFSLVFFTQSVLEVPTGIVSDTYLGRKGTMIAGALASVYSVVFYAMASSVSTLYMGAICEGLARSFYSGTDEALLYETLEETGEADRFAEYQGRVSSMFQFATFFASLLGAVAVLHSYKLVMWLSVIPQILCLLIACLFIEPIKHLKKKDTHVFAHMAEALFLFRRNRRLLWLGFANTVDFSFGEAGYYFQTAFVKIIIPEWAISIFRAFGNLGAGSGFWFAGRIIGGFGYFKVFIGSGIINLCAKIWAMLLANLATPFLFVSTSLLFGVTTTAKSTVMQREFSSQQRATLGSFVSLAGSLGFALVSLAVGMIADATSPFVALFAVYILPELISLPIYWMTLRKKSESELHN